MSAPVTAWGEAGGPNTISANRDRYGRVMEARSYRELSPDLPAEGIEIDCDHDGVRVGQLLYAELGTDNRLRAVCVLDSDGLDQAGQDVFFSPRFEMRGHGIDSRSTYIAREAELIGLSITFETARVGAHPVSWRQGDLRDPAARSSEWPSAWQQSDPLLARALEHLGTGWRSRSRSAESIVHERPSSYHFHRGRQVMPIELRRPRGELEHSVHRGKILRVY